MRLLPTLLCLAFTSCLTAQQIDLTGRVSIHNSRYQTGQIEYVADAFVSAPFAGETGTDSDGHFSLTFQGIEGGTIIKLAAEKAGLEIVNSRDLERVVLGQKSSLPIFLAPKGQLAKAQTELYNISKEALYARRDALIARLRGDKAESEAALAELSKDLGVDVSSIGEAMELMTTQVENLQKQLPEFAQELAAKNLDFASDLYIQAYEKFKRGDVRAALNILNGEALKRSYEQAIASQREGRQLIESGNELQQKAELQIQQVLESYRLKAQAHQTLFEYGAATATRQNIVDILEVRDGNEASLELAYAYDHLADALAISGDDISALEYQSKTVQVLAKHYPEGHPHLSLTQSTLANTFRGLGELDSAIYYLMIALDAQEASLPSDHPHLIRSYNSMILILQDLGEYERALPIINHIIAATENNPQSDTTTLYALYANLSSIHFGLGNYQQALSTQLVGIELLKRCTSDENHPDLAKYYTGLAITHQTLGDYKKALEFQEKAIQIQEAIFHARHPDLLQSQNNLALIYNSLGYYQAALSLELEVMAAVRQTLRPEHPLVATVLNNLFSINMSIGNYNEALPLIDESIRLKEASLGKQHHQVAVAYTNLAQLLSKQEKYPEALKAQIKALAIEKRTLTAGHPGFATTYHNLAGIYLELGQLDTALQHQLTANEINLLRKGTEHSDLAINYGQLARIYARKQDYPTAIRWQRKALSIAENALGPNHPDLANAYHRLTTIHYNQGKLDSAIISETQAFSLLRSAFPEGNHPSFEAIGQTLALLYYERGKKYYAEERLELAATDLEKARDLGISAPEISCYLARAYYNVAQLQLADNSLEECYRQEFIDRMTYLNNRSMILSRLGKYAEAKVLLTEALDKGGTTSPDYHRAAGLYHALSGEPETAINHLETALQLGFDDADWLATEPGLDGLRELPRFVSLLERLGE